MPITAVDDIEICYESFGADEAPPILLVMGLGAQLNLWPPGFVGELLDRGFRVIRFDNRDVGLSTKSQGDPPDVMSVFAAAAADESIEAPYSLSLLAQDAIGLLDALDIDAAHVVGASMGGMIAQVMAIEHPARVTSLTSIMSTTGAGDVGQPDPNAMAALLNPLPADRGAAIEQSVATGRVVGGSLFDEARSRAIAAESYDRCFHPPGFAFQIAAITATGDRTDRLGQVDVPTLVIHGREDSLVTLSGGEATASAIPGADLLVLARMGHDMPPQYWPQIADAIFNVAVRSDSR